MEFILTLISRLPFKVLYILSDIAYLFVYHLVGYRKKVVRKNLSASFPEKSEKELREIERKFYHWLCDYFVETLKLLTITPEEMKKHLEFRGLEQLVAVKKDGQGVSSFLGHYCNWEWLSAAGLYWPWPDDVMGLIYHPLRNDTFDELMIKMRSSLGGTCINKHHIHLWLDFLNHKTPVFTGAERIARKVNDLVVFVRMERPERGKYIANYHIISTNPNEEEEFAITKRCFAILENEIRKNPEFYLWTHNRWKRTYEEYVEKLQEKQEQGLQKDMP